MCHKHGTVLNWFPLTVDELAAAGHKYIRPELIKRFPLRQPRSGNTFNDFSVGGKISWLVLFQGGKFIKLAGC
jgi:hypothetical protein